MITITIVNDGVNVRWVFGKNLDSGSKSIKWTCSATVYRLFLSIWGHKGD